MDTDPAYAASYDRQQAARSNRDMPNDAEDDFMLDKSHDMAEGSLEEVDRRGFLKGMGAAAVAGAASGAKADRIWSKDEFSQQFVGIMTSETFPGAMLTWKDENKDFFLNLREPTNYSPNNVRDKRLYYPKITSPKFQIKFGDDQPISSTGEIYTFPLRQLGDYTGFGMVLARGKTFDRWRDSFINADKVVMRLEIDGQQTTVVFHENPGLLQQRNQQRANQEKLSQKKKEIDDDNAKIRANLRQQVIDEIIDQKGPIIPAIACAVAFENSPKGKQYGLLLKSLIDYFTQFMPGIPEHYQYIKQNSNGKTDVLGVPAEEWAKRLPSLYNQLKDAKDKIEAYSVKESVAQGMAEAPGAETLAHNQSTVASNEKAFDLEEGKPREKEADYGADYQDMVARVKKLAGMGPLKTVYDPQKRVYRNVPVAVQPPQQTKK
jgi:hypothetical protein